MSTADQQASFGPGQLGEVILADWNAEVPTDSDFLVKAWIDNNSELGVALDLNQSRPEGPPEKPEPPEPPIEPDPEADWIGSRLSGQTTNLPHSVYTEPDLTFVDPPDHEEPFGEFDLGEQLAVQVRERD